MGQQHAAKGSFKVLLDLVGAVCGVGKPPPPPPSSSLSSLVVAIDARASYLPRIF